MMDAEKRAGVRAMMRRGSRSNRADRPVSRSTLTRSAYCSAWRRRPRSSAIAGYLSELVEDGVTIQIGVGDPSSQMPRLGAFNRKEDLGLHTEMVAPGIARLVDAG